MLIVADENIPYVREAFGRLGDVLLTTGRTMTAESVHEADMLLVRSVTKVDRSLLEGSRVRFVGTATIGTDHVDLGYLRQAGIAFAAAPGSNANSVAEYVIAALLVVAGRKGWTLSDRSIGIVGVGNVGSRVEPKARALGMRVLLNDPPLQRATNDPKYRPIEELFDCDCITLHVPLERAGPDPTYHLSDAEFLAGMQRDTVLVNTSRGAVADNAALLSALETGRPAEAVLDVWEGEPSINAALLDRAALGTPHIAGYSLDGKVNGTEMLYRAACEWVGREPDWIAARNMPAPEFPEIPLEVGNRPVEDVLREAVLTVYPIERDDAALRATLDLPPEARAARFDHLRKTYPVRREFQNTVVRLVGGDSGRLREISERLAGIGFRVSDH